MPYTSPLGTRKLMEDMKVDLPDGTAGEVTLSHFDIADHALENARQLIKYGRGCSPGTYTRLDRKGVLWMSDTDAERSDHLEACIEVCRISHDEGRVLIGGLGLGCFLRAVLLTPQVKHVDVVEIDPDVIKLVAPTYKKMAKERGITLKIHQADLYAIKWPVGTRWDVAWFDIWPSLCTDNLEEMAKLNRSYGRRAGWEGCWGQALLIRERARERASGWW